MAEVIHTILKSIIGVILMLVGLSVFAGIQPLTSAAFIYMPAGILIFLPGFFLIKRAATE